MDENFSHHKAGSALQRFVSSIRAGGILTLGAISAGNPQQAKCPLQPVQARPTCKAEEKNST
jgi:hypothetical protein